MLAGEIGEGCETHTLCALPGGILRQAICVADGEGSKHDDETKWRTVGMEEGGLCFSDEPGMSLNNEGNSKEKNGSEQHSLWATKRLKASGEDPSNSWCG